jgi:hypothetical protein
MKQTRLHPSDLDERFRRGTVGDLANVTINQHFAL